MVEQKVVPEPRLNHLIGHHMWLQIDKLGNTLLNTVQYDSDNNNKISQTLINEWIKKNITNKRIKNAEFTKPFKN